MPKSTLVVRELNRCHDKSKVRVQITKWTTLAYTNCEKEVNCDKEVKNCDKEVNCEKEVKNCERSEPAQAMRKHRPMIGKFWKGMVLILKRHSDIPRLRDVMSAWEKSKVNAGKSHVIAWYGENGNSGWVHTLAYWVTRGKTGKWKNYTNLMVCGHFLSF